MQITYLGHSCVLLSGSKKVIIDPSVEGKSVLATNPDIVAVTHGHADHMGETVQINTVTVTITEIAKYLKTKGVPAESMNIGGTQVVDGVTFTMTRADHSSFIEEAGPGFAGGAAAGFVITLDGVTIYHAGDTGLFSDMRLIGELYHPQIAFLPIGGRYTMGVNEAMIAATWIGARTVIPIHYNTFSKIAADPQKFKTALERTTDITVRIMEPGETFTPGT